MHHAVHHGLLQHSCEVAAIGAGICATEAEFGYGSRADRDIVIAGGLLHDIGKIHELDCSAGVATYTAAGCLEGHVILGHSIVRDYARQCEISSRLLRALLHIILSHPGLPDHGAAVRPATLEAEIVHRADALSADMYMIHTAVSGASTDEMTVRVPGRDMWFFNAAADAGDALTAPVSASDPEPDNPFRTALYERAGVPPPQRSTDADDLGDPFRDS
jgi:3'-5' exoribonuclease